MSIPLRGRAYADPDPDQPDPAPGPERSNEDQEGQPKDWLNDPDEKKVAQQMTDLDIEYSKLPDTLEREARWKVNELRRDGFTGVRLVRDGEHGTHRPWVPMGGKANLELANEARRLSRVFVGNLFADPPAPQVFPADAGAADRDTADVSERALVDLQSDRRLNTGTKLRDATDSAATYGSGFVVYQIDPTGGGRRARTMQASPLAPDTQNPLVDPATGMPWGMQPAMPPMGGLEPMAPPPPPEPVERMVAQDELNFTDDPAQALYDWIPGLKSEVMSGRNVRLLPHTSENVWDAHAVLIRTYTPLKTLQSMFPKELGNLTEEQTAAIIGFRPHGSEDLLPANKRGRPANNEHALVYTLVVCYKECAQYPDGFYGIAVGGQFVPFRKPWVTFAGGKREPLLLPVSQVKLFRNGKIDYAGDGLMDDLGAMSEVQAAQIGHLLAYLDWFNNPTVYVPMHSTIQDADILARKPIIRILPGGEPKMLEPPRYPAESLTMFELMRDGASNAAHLMEAAQGVEDPNVKSGRHAYQIVAQAHAQLSEPKQNIERGFVRCCEIELQYARAFDLDGDARWTGDDGTYKLEKWTGADLGGDVKLQPGTMTMLSPAAKAQLVEQWMMAGLLSPDEGREMLSQGIGAVIGLRDNPFRLEIRRQIAAWEAGPPEGWMPPPPPMPVLDEAGAPVPEVDPVSGQPAVDPATGGPVPAMTVPPPDPALELIWEPRAHHQLPLVAQMRVDELAKLMASARYHGHDRAWQGLVEQEFMRCAMMAQPPAPQVDEDGNPVEEKPAAPGGASVGGAGAGMPSMDPPMAA